jgi:hypothetical protein
MRKLITSQLWPCWRRLPAAPLTRIGPRITELAPPRGPGEVEEITMLVRILGWAREPS